VTGRGVPCTGAGRGQAESGFGHAAGAPAGALVSGAGVNFKTLVKELPPYATQSGKRTSPLLPAPTCGFAARGFRLRLLSFARRLPVLAGGLALALSWSSPAPAATQRYIKRQLQVSIQLAWVMTDGTVLGQGYDNSSWYKYTPDAMGSYADGTWTQLASLPSGYAPSAFSSAVLADGRLAISGGEYNNGGQYQLQLTNLGAIYDPAKNTWTPIGHPKGWGFIGDSPNSVLPGGQFLVGQKLTEEAAYLDPKTLKWTMVGTAGKADFNSEEGWTLLPNGTILTADVKDAPNSEIYNPTAGTWTSAGSTIVDLHSPSPYSTCLQYGPKKKDCYLPPGEIGPAILRPDGTVFATGSGSGPNGYGAGHTAVYHTTGSHAGTWTTGPDFPNGDDAGDSFAALLPSGNVLVLGVEGYLYEWNGTTFVQTGSAGGPMLLLPSGQVMIFGYNGTSLYSGAGQPQASWAPAIMSVATKLTHGKTYPIAGTQFNGLSQAMSFGDEYQNATNYPLVRITNVASSHVFYAKTHDHSTMAVATGSTVVSTNFDVPAKIDSGPSMLQVVANGIASNPVSVSIK
jgi:hypothetical protein